MRVGLAASIEGDGNGSALIQPAVDVVVDDGVHPVSGPQIQLRGPGDVLALNPAEIKRRVPEAGAVGAETNYFCAVEFFAPDLPWRYTPTAVADGQLSPWLVLVVVELGDGVTLSSGGRLPVLSVESPADHLPDLVDSWAWAHVQSAVPIDGSFAKTYDADPTAFTSRLLCPRRLRADTSYTACLVPAFDVRPASRTRLDRHGDRRAGVDLGEGRASRVRLVGAHRRRPLRLQDARQADQAGRAARGRRVPRPRSHRPRSRDPSDLDTGDVRRGDARPDRQPSSTGTTTTTATSSRAMFASDS